jgi:hypothetical protein
MMDEPWWKCPFLLKKTMTIEVKNVPLCCTHSSVSDLSVGPQDQSKYGVKKKNSFLFFKSNPLFTPWPATLTTDLLQYTEYTEKRKQ